MKPFEKIVPDKELGDVLFRKSSQAKRYIIKIKNQTVTVVIPHSGKYLIARAFLLKNKAKVIEVLRKVQEPPSVQCLAEDELRRKAKAYLPAKTEQLAAIHGFTYTSLSIRPSRTRWGSCSSRKSINLSFFLMMLPEHLIEYVILHELCHTVHMNHSPAFWALLDQHLGQNSKALRRELRSYIIPPNSER